MLPRRIAVESWDPEYGVPAEASAMAQSDVSIDTAIELPASRWSPVRPPDPLYLPDNILFIDGVRRIDGYAWITQGDALPFRSLLASCAAGAAIAGQRAKIFATETQRVLLTASETPSLVTRAGEYMPHIAAADSPEELLIALQSQLTNLEIEVATQASGEAEVIIIDGPLRGRQGIEGALGYVKTHRVWYLPEPLRPVVGSLPARHRTPVFMFTTSWSRYSWYLRLPGTALHAWWGIVRVEAPDNLTTRQVIERANVSATLLPRYATAPHKDPRAPQNLYPIAELERELRRRLGDPQYVQRALRMVTSELASNDV